MSTVLRPPEIYRCCLWMWHYGAPTAKRTVLWSSSRSIGLFWTAPLRRIQYKQAIKDEPNRPKPVQKYVDSNGRQRYHGTSELKATESRAHLKGLVGVETSVCVHQPASFGGRDHRSANKALHPDFWKEDCLLVRKAQTRMSIYRWRSDQRWTCYLGSLGVGRSVGGCSHAIFHQVLVRSSFSEGAPSMETASPQNHLRGFSLGLTKVMATI